MAYIFLILGFFLSFVGSIIAGAVMADITGIAIGTDFLTSWFAWSLFSMLIKVLWKRREIERIIHCLVAMMIVPIIVSIIATIIFNIIKANSSSTVVEIISDIIATATIISLSYAGLSVVASNLKKRYNIDDEKVMAEIKEEELNKAKNEEEKKSADKRLKEKINTEDSDDHSTTKDVEFITTHPDVVLSEMGNYIKVNLSIKEIEKQILKILEAASLPADTLMVLSRSTNMARRMDVLSSEYYAMVDEVIAVDTSAKRNAANMIKPLAMQAMILSVKSDT